METIILEQWLHDRIRRNAEDDPEFRRFLGGEDLEQVSRASVESYQLFELKKVLSYVYCNSPFYKELFSKNSVRPEDIESLDDLANITLTDPADLAESPYRFLCVSMGDIARPVTFISSGTSGPQKRVFSTSKDLEHIIEFMEMGMRTVTKEGDVVQILLPGGVPLGQLDLLAQAVERIGAFPVKAGTDLSSEEQLELVEKHKSTIIFGWPSYIYRITREMLTKGHDLAGLGVKTLFFTAEYLSLPMRERLEEIWNCRVSLHYGLTEMGLGVAVECQAHNGFHFNEAGLILEVVDPKTGEVIKDDREGELVFTTLNKEGTPLIRYRTHDLASLIVEPCPCGANTLIKFNNVKRRLESIVQIGEGDEIYPSLFDDLLYNIPEVIDYQVSLGRTGGKDCLAFRVEVIRPGNDIEEKIKKILTDFSLIQKNINTGRMTDLELDVVGIGELRHSGSAKKMIVDSRQ